MNLFHLEMRLLDPADAKIYFTSLTMMRNPSEYLTIRVFNHKDRAYD